jgi:pyridoxine 5-phosphate synthase
MARLSVNVDHIATLRQARLVAEPDPVTAAMLVEIAGANGITVHLREDRRHIQDRDLTILKQMIKTSLNLEMAATPEMLKIALDIRPDMITVVPEKRKELTTEGGLDLRLHRERDYLKRFIASLKDADIRVNLFIDPDPEQIRNAHKLSSNGVEIHTGRYADTKKRSSMAEELKRIYDTAVLADRLGLSVHAGHGLDYNNVSRVVQIEEIKEFAIGFSIIARSVIVGIEKAVKEMLELVK